MNFKQRAEDLRARFIDVLGLPKAKTLEGSYKGGNKEALNEAIAIRNEFAQIVKETGLYAPILAKMDRNLENADRGSVYKK